MTAFTKPAKLEYGPMNGPNDRGPERVWEAMGQDGQEVYWQKVPKERISVPEYIEGMAKQTIKQMYGQYYKKITKQR